MKISEAVLESMSYIDESILAESEAEKKTAFSWKPFLSFAAVGVKRELRDDQHFTANICERGACVMLAVRKDAQFEDFVPQLFDFSFGVAFAYAKQHEIPRPACAHDVFAD